MIRIRNFGNDKMCADVSELMSSILEYRGKSVSIDDTRPGGKLIFVDVSETGEVRNSYGANEPIDLATVLTREAQL